MRYVEKSAVETLLKQTFLIVSQDLRLSHEFLLLVDGTSQRLYNVASHGFERAHFGAEIAMGEGIYGMAAARKTPTRTGSVRRDRLLAKAVARERHHQDPTYLPLPGLFEVESTVVSLLRCEVNCFDTAIRNALKWQTPGDGCDH